MMYRFSSLLSILTMLLILVSAEAGHAEVTVSATLSKTSFSIDERGQLVVTINGARSVNLEIPESEGFSLTQRGRSSQFNMVNGEVSSSVVFTCIIDPYKTGKHIIPQITIKADGKTLTTEIIPFEVTGTTQQTTPGPAKSPPPQQGKSGPSATFITLHAYKPTTYLGEITPIEIKAYFRHGLRANLTSTPQLTGDGVVMAQLHDQPRQSQEYVNDTVYNVLSWETTLTSIKEGEHTIRFNIEATQLIPQRQHSTSMMGRPSPFEDDFFDSFFGSSYKRVPLNVLSPQIDIAVRPLPEVGKPPTFTGAIGDFTFIASVQPTAVEEGEPFTLKMTVGGKGNFQRVEPPDFPAHEGWKTYSPSTTFHGENNSPYKGKVVFEQAIVARDSNLHEIPPLEFSFFNPKTGKYITHTTSAIPVSINGNSSVTAVTQKNIVQPPAPPTSHRLAKKTERKLEGLAPIKVEIGKVYSAFTPPFRRPVFLVFITVCSLILLGSAFYWICWTRYIRSPQEIMRRAQEKELKKYIAQVKEAYVSSDSNAFLVAARAAIQQNLGDRWHREPASITRADLDENLPTDSPLLELFTGLEEAAYSGSQLRRETMERYLRELERALGANT